MSTRIWKVVRGVVFVWGCVSLLGAVVLGAFLAYQIGPGNHTRVDSVSATDVRFVLNWCGLGAERIQKVLHSYVSRRSFTGDHLDAYAIKISHVEIAELTAASREPYNRWYRGD